MQKEIYKYLLLSKKYFVKSNTQLSCLLSITHFLYRAYKKTPSNNRSPNFFINDIDFVFIDFLKSKSKYAHTF